MLDNNNRPPVFTDIPTYSIKENPYSYIYVDMTYDCNMKCNFCYNPIRHYDDLDIDYFKDVCQQLPKPVQFRFLGGEPTLYNKLEEAIDIAYEYGHNISLCTNGLKFSNLKFAEDFKKIWDRHKTMVVSITLNGGLEHDEWYEKIDGRACAKQKSKALENLINLNYKRICIAAIIVKDLNEGIIKEFYDLSKKYYRRITNIRFRTAAKQGRWDEEIVEKQTSYTGVELNELVKTIIPEANQPYRWLRDGINPSTVKGKHINSPNLKCHQCCMMYYINPKTWVSVLEFGGHGSTQCWRRGQLVQSNSTIQPFHLHMDKFSDYINTFDAL